MCAHVCVWACVRACEVCVCVHTHVVCVYTCPLTSMHTDSRMHGRLHSQRGKSCQAGLDGQPWGLHRHPEEGERTLHMAGAEHTCPSAWLSFGMSPQIHNLLSAPSPLATLCLGGLTPLFHMPVWGLYPGHRSTILTVPEGALGIAAPAPAHPSTMGLRGRSFLH